MNHVIDATGKSLGRLASDIASKLMGKDTASFSRHQLSQNRVTVEHVSHMSISDKKKMHTTYLRYSGYPGGLSKENLKELLEKKGHAEALRRAVSGMLPKNSLREKMLTKLSIK